LVQLHYKLSHHRFKQTPFLARKGWLGGGVQGLLSKPIDVPHSTACKMGKQTRQPSGTMTSMTTRSGSLSYDALTPGQVIYSDQYSARRVKGKGNPEHTRIGQKQEYTGGRVF